MGASPLLQRGKIARAVAPPSGKQLRKGHPALAARPLCSHPLVILHRQAEMLKDKVVRLIRAAPTWKAIVCIGSFLATTKHATYMDCLVLSSTTKPHPFHPPKTIPLLIELALSTYTDLRGQVTSRKQDRFRARSAQEPCLHVA